MKIFAITIVGLVLSLILFIAGLCMLLYMIRKKHLIYIIRKKHLNKDKIKTYKEELSVILSFWGISIFILAIFAWDYYVAYDKESILYSGLVLPKKSSNKGFSFVEYFQNNKTKISEIWKAGQTGSYVLFANGTLSNNVVIEQNVGDGVYYYCKGGVHMNKRKK